MKRFSHLGPVGFAGLLIVAGFLATSLAYYFVSTRSAKEVVKTVALPLTSDNVYSEIQRDLLRPVFVSSLMATDTFLRDWVLDGERDPEKIRKYLSEIKSRYNAVTSFFVSEKSRVYYHAGGVLKKISEGEPRDAWYFRVRLMKEPYEINVDPDLANRDAMTIFINYRVLDYKGEYLGVTGVGLTVGAVKELIETYQKRFGRTVYFCDKTGSVVLHGSGYGGPPNLAARPGLSVSPEGLAGSGNRVVEFTEGGETVLQSARYIPELNWVLVVEQRASDLLGDFRATLRISLAICAVVTLLVMLVSRRAINRYQEKISEMALTDGLTGLANRRSFSISFEQIVNQVIRHPEDISLLMLDIDHFKEVNDLHGHNAGDEVLRKLAELLTGRMRGWDVVCRWGGEEFLILMKGAEIADAAMVAENLCEEIALELFAVDAKSLSITVSIGVGALCVGDSESQAVARADAALYEAKVAGRNRVAVKEC